MIKLNPACFEGFPLSITNQGYLLPCCYCDDKETIEDEEFQKLYTASNISDYDTIEEIIYSDKWIEFFENLKKHKGPPACRNTCSENIRPRKDVYMETKADLIEEEKVDTMSKLFGGGRNNQTFYWDWVEGSDNPDNEKNYRKNKKKLGTNWYYYDKPISYVHNSKGFRTYPLNKIDWKNSIVIFGCSIVHGVGNAVEDTISSIIEDRLGITVVNLGVSGTGIDAACFNSLAVHNHFPHPKAIVQLWSGIERYCEFNNQDIKHFLPHHSSFCLRHNWEERNKLYVEFDRTIWKDKTLRYEASFFEDSSRILNVDRLEELDKGRDMIHPGYKTLKAAAEKIIENLKSQGLE